MSGKFEKKNIDQTENAIIYIILLEFMKAYVFARNDTKFSFTYWLPTTELNEGFDDLLAERFWEIFRLYISIAPHPTQVLSFEVSHNPEDLE